MNKPEILTRASADKLALYDRLKTGKPGDTIAWAELEAIINRPVRSGTLGYEPLRRARWKCVKEYGIVWEPISDHSGLKCLNDAEILKLGAHALTSLRRKARRANIKLASADGAKLGNAERVTLASLMALNAAIETAATDKSLHRIEGAMGSEVKPMPVGKTLEILQA